MAESQPRPNGRDSLFALRMFCYTGAASRARERRKCFINTCDAGTCNREKKMADHKIHEHHEKAAEHHEHAAKHHREAAKHHKAGNHEKAAHHSKIAHGHHLHATEHHEHTSKKHAEEHG
jgi:hypothetical protein